MYNPASNPCSAVFRGILGGVPTKNSLRSQCAESQPLCCQCTIMGNIVIGRGVPYLAASHASIAEPTMAALTSNTLRSTMGTVWGTTKPFTDLAGCVKPILGPPTHSVFVGRNAHGKNQGCAGCTIFHTAKGPSLLDG